MDGKVLWKRDYVFAAKLFSATKVHNASFSIYAKTHKAVLLMCLSSFCTLNALCAVNVS